MTEYQTTVLDRVIDAMNSAVDKATETGIVSPVDVWGNVAAGALTSFLLAQRDRGTLEVRDTDTLLDWCTRVAHRSIWQAKKINLAEQVESRRALQ